MSIKSITLRNYRAFGASGVTVPLDHEFTAIVGVNNSGKSSILRSFFELRPIFNILATIPLGDNRLTNVLGPTGLAVAHPTLAAGESIFPKSDKAAEPRITFEFHAEETPQSVTSLTLIYQRDGNLRAEGTTVASSFSSLNSVTTVVGQNGLTQLSATNRGGETIQIDWMPVMKDFEWLNQAMYIGPFRNAIDSGGAEHYDLSVGKDFLVKLDDYKTGSNPAANEAVQQMCDELAQIFDIDRIEVNISADQSTFSYMLDGRSYRGSEQGAGLTQFLIVAANVLVRKPTLLLLDEPELNLHASLQLQFLALLAKYAVDGVVFSTHSLGLARSGADRTIVVTRDKGGQASGSDYRAVPNLSSTLGELGYGGLNDSAFKAVLLVEGVTEVRVLQELLTKFGVRSEVVIVPLGGDDLAAGANEVEIAELAKLSDNVFALVDSERTTSGSKPATRRLPSKRFAPS